MGLLDSVLGAVTGVDWESRATDGKYTSPSGKTLGFLWGKTQEGGNARATVHELMDGSGVYCSDLGRDGRRWPMRLVFAGDDCDLAAAAFMELLDERGLGELQHPLYGTRTVLPVGKYSREDDYLDGGGVVVITVTFVCSLLSAWPSTGDGQEDAASAFDAFNAAAAARFASAADIESAGALKKAVASYRKTLATVKAGADAVTRGQALTRDAMESVYRDVIAGIDTFAVTPLLLADQALLLAQTPATLLGRIESRLGDVAGLASGLIDALSGSGSSARAEAPGVWAPASSIQGPAAEEIAAGELVNLCRSGGIAGAAVGAVAAAAGGGFQSRAEVLDVVAQLEALLESYQADDDADTEAALALGLEVDTAPRAALVECVRRSVALLTQQAFALRAERSTTLQRSQTLIDLCWDLHGDTSEAHLNSLIQLNDVAGEMFELIPEGTVVRWLT